MLSTLTKIGEQLLEGKGIWARLTTEPKYNKDKNKWICPILFDCVNQKICILKDEMKSFKPEVSAIEFRYLSSELWGRRGKKCALTVEFKNYSMLEETIFGKKPGDNGSMIRTIEEFPELVAKPIYNALLEINSIFIHNRQELDFDEVKKQLTLGSQDEVVLFYSLVKLDNFNNGKPIKLIDLDGYDDFILAKFGTEGEGEKGLDYTSGNAVQVAIEANFTGRYNINKIFQTTTSNYASGFSDFKRNFQIPPNTLAALNKASQYILDNLKTRIAGISHVIIPNFFNKDLEEFDINETELFLDRSSDLLFKYYSLDADFEKELPDTMLFWINYIAFESDGNSFKIMNHIKDVNSQYLRQLIRIFDQTGIDFRPYIGGKYTFNLQAVYFIIPARDENKSKNNPALNLFKDILEQRSIDVDALYSNFINLALCYWYRRYIAFPNIRRNESFDFAIKDAVFKYSALIYALKQLNLLDMENKESITTKHPERSKSEFQKRIEQFFDKMEYSENETAMFFLGRVLSSVAYAQYKKGHESKPVLNKVNFNGMDAQAVMRLSLDLAEKARQYSIHRETDWNFACFREKFNEKDWPLSNEQNVFYLMAGYSFRPTKSDNN